MTKAENPNWVSADLHTLKEVYVNPHTSELMSFIVPPDIARRLRSGNPYYYNIATRSRIAQIGLEVGPYSTSMALIEQTLEPHGKKYKENHSMYAQVEVMNHSERAIYVPGGITIFRLLHKASSSLKGAELLRAIAERVIRVSGDYGKDWVWDFSNGSKKDEDIKGIKFKLDPASHKWMPPSSDPSPLNLNNIVQLGSRQYRDYIDSLLVPISASSEPSLTISETISQLTLNGAHALIYPLVKVLAEHGRTKHINSLFVENGSNWRIRTETFGPTTKEDLARQVTMHFWKT